MISKRQWTSERVDKLRFQMQHMLPTGVSCLSRSRQHPTQLRLRKETVGVQRNCKIPTSGMGTRWAPPWTWPHHPPSYPKRIVSLPGQSPSTILRLARMPRAKPSKVIKLQKPSSPRITSHARRGTI
jgi:hypothetical protein